MFLVVILVLTMLLGMVLFDAMARLGMMRLISMAVIVAIYGPPMFIPFVVGGPMGMPVANIDVSMRFGHPVTCAVVPIKGNAFGRVVNNIALIQHRLVTVLDRRGRPDYHGSGGNHAAGQGERH
jgi:hypothetical protein